MASTDHLDPATLRWAADDCSRTVASANRLANNFMERHNRTGDEDSRRRSEWWRDWAYRHKRRATRYRSLATRIETKRGRR